MGGYEGAAAVALAEQYEGLPFEQVHAAALPYLPESNALVLDVGSGSGRDAAWFSACGHEVIAVEPSGDMRAEAEKRHGKVARWLADSLPALDGVHRLGLSFDLVWLSAVWMHVPPRDRWRAFRKMVTLLRPGGRIIMTLRHGPAPEGREMHPVSRAEVEALAAEHGAFLLASKQSDDQQARTSVSWETLVIRLVDDGTGALPLIRQIVLADSKSSTYKIALLRTVARAADAAPGLARVGDDNVTVPLGLIGLFWMRSFLPLINADLPQTPTNRRSSGLGFVKDAFLRLRVVSPSELRVGAVFLDHEIAAALNAAIKDACSVIAKMPAYYTTYPGTDQQVFQVQSERRWKKTGGVIIDEEFLWSFGSFSIPLHIWQALTRLNTWIEPALLAEWTRLIQRYLLGQGRTVPEGVIAACLEWLDPARDTVRVRQRAQLMLDNGEPVYCVWSGQRLTMRQLDIDHCFPFAAWPNGDAWNLLPSNRRINQHSKRDKLPSAVLLNGARDRLQDWWNRAYLRSPLWEEKFWKEARASLPIIGSDYDTGTVHEAMGVKRLMLYTTQQLPEWSGA